MPAGRTPAAVRARMCHYVWRGAAQREPGLHRTLRLLLGWTTRCLKQRLDRVPKEAADMTRAPSDPVPMRIRYDTIEDETGWTVFDIFTGLPVEVLDVPQIGLPSEDAEDMAMSSASSEGRPI